MSLKLFSVFLETKNKLLILFRSLYIQFHGNRHFKVEGLIAWCGSNFKTCESTRGGGSKRSGGNRSITTW